VNTSTINACHSFEADRSANDFTLTPIKDQIVVVAAREAAWAGHRTRRLPPWADEGSEGGAET
jgi:hypothetical protein